MSQLLVTASLPLNEDALSNSHAVTKQEVGSAVDLNGVTVNTVKGEVDSGTDSIMTLNGPASTVHGPSAHVDSTTAVNHEEPISSKKVHADPVVKVGLEIGSVQETKPEHLKEEKAPSIEPSLVTQPHDSNSAGLTSSSLPGSQTSAFASSVDQAPPSTTPFTPKPGNRKRAAQEAGTKGKKKGSSGATASASEDKGTSQTRCPCGDNENEDGFMICCEACDCWQHGECVGVHESDVPENYFCELCQPEHAIHKRRRATAPNGVFFIRKAKGGKKVVNRDRGSGVRVKRKRADGKEDAEDEDGSDAGGGAPSQSAGLSKRTRGSSASEGEEGSGDGSGGHVAAPVGTSNIRAANAGSTNGAATSSNNPNVNNSHSVNDSSDLNHLLAIDDSKLTRDQRKLKKYMETFQRMEERERKAASDALTPKAVRGGDDDHGSGIGSSLSSSNVGSDSNRSTSAKGKGGSSASNSTHPRPISSNAAAAAIANASNGGEDADNLAVGKDSSLDSFGKGIGSGGGGGAGGGENGDADIGLDEDDPRVQRMRQRERAREIEESQTRRGDDSDDETEAGRPETPPSIGPPRAIHPPQWIMRKLYARSELYMGKKAYLLRDTERLLGPFGSGFVEAADVGPISKRLLMNSNADKLALQLASTHMRNSLQFDSLES